MVRNNREWFDFVYDAMRVGMSTRDYSTMAFYTSNSKYINDARQLAFKHNAKLIGLMKDAASRVPSAGAFRKEKIMVIATSRDEVREAFSDFDAMFYFGRDCGDIDLAGIKAAAGVVRPSEDIKMKYPLYDWNSIRDLSATHSWAVIDKLVRGDSLDSSVSIGMAAKKARSTMKRSKLVFGDKKYLEDMHRTARFYRSM